MGFNPAVLWQAPEVNPVNFKARTIPAFNPINKYGRVFFFSWWGFMIAFWSWYAFPPLLTLTIKKDLGLTQTDIANSNIIALLATLLVRLVAGPCCDRFGPRLTFAACLLAGAIPTALAGAVTNKSGLLALRFFIGILGGSFVPCQVWSTGYFDKNIVGTANALTGGLGNSGGGITYFVMPAIFDSLVANQHLTPHVAWRVAFIVPFVLITLTAILMVILCDDTPTGKWADRNMVVEQNLMAHGVTESSNSLPEKQSSTGSVSPGDRKILQEEADLATAKHGSFDHEAAMNPRDMIDTAQGEVIVKPTLSEALKVTFSPQVLVVAGCYFCSFGAELAINSVLGSLYLENFPSLGQSGTGRWAAMFGLLNIVLRPLGGAVSDLLYRKTGSVWAKKIWLHTLGIICGVMLIIIGVLDSKDQATMFGLIACMGFFLEGGNGANFSLVPHVFPFANGIVSGVTGAAGNFGGIIFAIIFRYNGVHYTKVFWIIGAITIGINVALSWIRPVAKSQIGGR